MSHITPLQPLACSGYDPSSLKYKIDLAGCGPGHVDVNQSRSCVNMSCSMVFMGVSLVTDYNLTILATHRSITLREFRLTIGE